MNDVRISNIQQLQIENIYKEIVNLLNKSIPQKKAMREYKWDAVISFFSSVGVLFDRICASFDYWLVYQEILPEKLVSEKVVKKLAVIKAIL